MDAAAHAERPKADGLASQTQDHFPKLSLSARQSIDRTDQSHSAGLGKLLRDWTFEPVLRVHPRLGRKEDSAPSGPSRSAPGLRMEAVEQGMAVWDLGTLLWVPSLASTVIFGSRPILIRLITLAANCAGARSAVNPHAACDVADVGDGATENPNRARRGKPWIQAKDDPTDHRASVRPYQVEECLTHVGTEGSRAHQRPERIYCFRHELCGAGHGRNLSPSDGILVV